MASWRARFADAAARREAKGLTRALRLHPPGMVDFSSNDYLGLSAHPAVREAAAEAAINFGVGARASRLVNGNLAIHEELEAALADFKNCESALLFPSGYQANLGLLSTLLATDDAVFVDRLAHACLVDGVRLSGARLRVFPHNDLARLEVLLRAAATAPARWILVDGLYSMDGDIASLPGLLDLADRYDATVVLDDAHGTGVLGASGRGTAEHFGLRPRDCGDRLIVVATLSKALGSQGAVVLGPVALREELVNASRPFVYSTGLSPVCAAAALAALRALESTPQLVASLAQKSSRAVALLTAAGCDVMATQSAIVPVRFGPPEPTLAAASALRAEGILAVAIRPPTVPRGTSRLRLTVNLGIPDELFEGSLQRVAEISQSVLSQPRTSDTPNDGE